MALSITSLSFDKAAYNTGDTITLTAEYSTDDLAAVAASDFVATVSVSDDASGTITGDAPFSINGAAAGAQPVTVSATDTRPGEWTLVSNDVSGDAAPFTGTAVLTSVA